MCNPPLLSAYNFPGSLWTCSLASLSQRLLPADQIGLTALFLDSETELNGTVPGTESCIIQSPSRKRGIRTLRERQSASPSPSVCQLLSPHFRVLFSMINRKPSRRLVAGRPRQCSEASTLRLPIPRAQVPLPSTETISLMENAGTGSQQEVDAHSPGRKQLFFLCSELL